MNRKNDLRIELKIGLLVLAAFGILNTMVTGVPNFVKLIVFGIGIVLTFIGGVVKEK